MFQFATISFIDFKTLVTGVEMIGRLIKIVCDVRKGLGASTSIHANSHLNVPLQLNQ